MSTAERRRQLLKFVEQEDPTLIGSLHEALYTASESGVWPDEIDSMSVEQAILVWKIVEKLRVAQFPNELRM